MRNRDEWRKEATLAIAIACNERLLRVEPPRSRVRAERSGFRRIRVVRARPGGPLKAPEV
jgi:hypothetical protein